MQFRPNKYEHELQYAQMQALTHEHAHTATFTPASTRMLLTLTCKFASHVFVVDTFGSSATLLHANITLALDRIALLYLPRAKLGRRKDKRNCGRRKRKRI